MGRSDGTSTRQARGGRHRARNRHRLRQRDARAIGGRTGRAGLPRPAPDAPAATPTERVVGGIAFQERPVASLDPQLGPNEADAVIRAELGAGRATFATEALGVPAMRTVDGAFVPGLVGALGPAGQTVFDAATPVAAWVIVMEGHGADGGYIVIGVVDDRTGRPLTVYVVTPGSG